MKGSVFHDHAVAAGITGKGDRLPVGTARCALVLEHL